jgi:hypothetical protein
MPNGGTRFIRAELMEVSLVSCPANANALAVARSLNVSDETIHRVFEGVEDDPWAAWNAWADSKIDARLGPSLDMIADVIGEQTGKTERLLRDELKKLRDMATATDRTVKAMKGELKALSDARTRVVRAAIERGEVAEILHGTVGTSRKRDVQQ